MSQDDLLEYMSKLYAMLIWGNKQYFVDKLIDDNGFEELKKKLADLIWGKDPIEKRWDRAMKGIKGFGPAMQSELLCYVHPHDHMLWNRRAYVGFSYLGVSGLPKYNYQITGKKYKELSDIARTIADEMGKLGARDTSLLSVDYFIWEELQVEENLSQIFKKANEVKPVEKLSKEESGFVHNEIRDYLRDIGQWLGFNASIEKKVADGSKVDTVWESTIGNMGRVLYVYEVQTKGSVDSLILNLLKAKNNPAVQGVVAVSDKEQIEKIKKHASDVPGLKDMKFWDYEEVIQVHESLEFVNTSINKLNLVPEGF
ncbi:MAG: hypothetical protein K9J27_12000 [Bacteroidales bacterium]|nr:hypothetical protein [Bacteroidales bacterium]